MKLEIINGQVRATAENAIESIKLLSIDSVEKKVEVIEKKTRKKSSVPAQCPVCKKWFKNIHAVHVHMAMVGHKIENVTGTMSTVG